MRSNLHRGAVATAYQLTMMTGIMLLPFAVVVRRTVGVTLPLHRIIAPILAAYEAATDDE